MGLRQCPDFGCVLISLHQTWQSCFHLHSELTSEAKENGVGTGREAFTLVPVFNASLFVYPQIHLSFHYLCFITASQKIDYQIIFFLKDSLSLYIYINLVCVSFLRSCDSAWATVPDNMRLFFSPRQYFL